MLYCFFFFFEKLKLFEVLSFLSDLFLLTFRTHRPPSIGGQMWIILFLIRLGSKIMQWSTAGNNNFDIILIFLSILMLRNQFLIIILIFLSSFYFKPSKHQLTVQLSMFTLKNTKQLLLRLNSFI